MIRWLFRKVFGRVFDEAAERELTACKTGLHEHVRHRLANHDAKLERQLSRFGLTQDGTLLERFTRIEAKVDGHAADIEKYRLAWTTDKRELLDEVRAIVGRQAGATEVPGTPFD